MPREDWSAMLIEVGRLQRRAYESLNSFHGGERSFQRLLDADCAVAEMLSLTARLHERITQMVDDHSDHAPWP